MRHSLHLPLMVCTVFFLDCSSTSATFYDRERIALIKSWEIVYSYSYGEPEATVSPWDQPTDAAKVTLPGGDLRLADNIVLRLKNKHHVPVTTAGLAEGQIHLHAFLFASGGCKSLDVAVLDVNSQLLARTRIWNRSRSTMFTYDDSFAVHAADAIADLLKHP